MKNTVKPARAQRGVAIQSSENERFSRMKEPWY